VANAYTNRKLSARYPTDLSAWKALAKHYKDDMRSKHLHELFKRDKKRAVRYSVQANDLTLDFSKNHVNATTVKHFAHRSDVRG
jgi:glucose-6-phosphate isomerase